MRRPFRQSWRISGRVLHIGRVSLPIRGSRSADEQREALGAFGAAAALQFGEGCWRG